MTAPAKPLIIVEPFAKNAGEGYITLPVPVPGQTGVQNNSASFDTGFPVATFLSAEAGGRPPNGADVNGMFYMVSAYLAFFQSGQVLGYDAVAQTAFGGYPIGALLAKSADPTEFWINRVAANTTDPDTGGAGWQSSVPLYDAVAPAAGAHNNYALPGYSDYILDVDTTAGDMSFTGFVAQRHGQTLYINNVGVNNLTVDALNGGSTAGNQVRAPGDYALSQYGSLAIRYSQGAGKWLIV